MIRSASYAVRGADHQVVFLGPPDPARQPRRRHRLRRLDGTTTTCPSAVLCSILYFLGPHHPSHQPARDRPELFADGATQDDSRSRCRGPWRPTWRAKTQPDLAAPLTSVTISGPLSRRLGKNVEGLVQKLAGDDFEHLTQRRVIEHLVGGRVAPG